MATEGITELRSRSKVFTRCRAARQPGQYRRDPDRADRLGVESELRARLLNRIRVIGNCLANNTFTAIFQYPP